MSKPTPISEQLRREDQSRAMTHSILIHAAFIKLASETLKTLKPKEN